MRTSLSLSGGGAGGAFQIGVLSNIWERERGNISSIYGTSVGALNGAALRQIDLDDLKKIWLGIRGRGDVLKFNWLTLFGLSHGKYSAGPLRWMVNDLFKLPPKNPHIDVHVSAVDLDTTAITYFKHDHENFAHMVLASAAVPFHMEPIGQMVDGGVRDHTPIMQAVDDGAERVIVICNNPLRRSVRESYKPSWPYLVSHGLRAVDILQSEILWNDLSRIMDRNKYEKKISLEVYAPDVRIIDTFEYDPKKIRAAIEQGENTKPILID